MRLLFLGGTILATLLTFYSALWHKSEAIEDDIEERSVEAIEAAGGRDIDVDVDGRHVTLTGVVYSEAREDELLDIADETYGALGPIDGLTVIEDVAYITASKTDDGITLTGSVPSEEVRSEIVTAATDATDGTVTDEMVVFGQRHGWHDEAGFGLSQLGALSTGTLTLGGETQVLAGTAIGSADDISAELEARGDWIGSISPRDRTDEFEARIASLESDLNTQTAAMADMEQRLSAERDALQVNLASANEALTTATTDVEAAMAELEGRAQALEDSEAALAALSLETEELRAQLADLQQARADLTTELDAAQGDTAGLDIAERQLEEQEAAFSALSEEADGLRVQLAEQEQRIADLTAQLDAAGGASDAQATDTEEVTRLTTELASAEQRIVRLDQQIDELTAGAPVITPSASAEQCTIRAEQVVEASRINFVTGSAEISEESQGLLERLTGIALACVDQGVVLEIGGHTDDRGDDASNQQLSEARAQAVSSFMLERGVPEEGLSAVGYGETQPIADNATEEGQAANRRISFDWRPPQ